VGPAPDRNLVRVRDRGEWALDVERIVVAVASAGGHLAALAAADPGRFVDPELPLELARVSAAVSGAIDYVGPSDLQTFSLAGGWAPALMAALLGCVPAQPASCDPSRVADASVATHFHGRPLRRWGRQRSRLALAAAGARRVAALSGRLLHVVSVRSFRSRHELGSWK
jgi:hypothetical protein